MNLSDYDQLQESEKIEIGKLIRENIEAIYDQRFSYKIFTNPNYSHLIISEDLTTEEKVDRYFIGYWCLKCQDWIEGSSDIAVVNHVVEHLNNIDVVEVEVNEL